MTVGTDTTQKAPRSEVFWRSMGYFNLYRLFIACIFVGSYFFLHERAWWDTYDSALYLQSALGYMAASLVAITFSGLRWPRFNRQLTLQVITDIGFIVLLMYAAGGIKSGLGLLLVVAIAGASLISQGKQALFYAALASIALLLEQSYQLLTWDERYNDYTHVVMLSLSCFATAWLAHSFAKRTDRSEALASQRGIDLENMAQVNELITREMQDGVLVVDKDFNLRHHNSQVENLLGFSTSAWHESSLDQCMPELASLMRKWIGEGSDISPAAMKLSSGERELRLRFMPLGIDRKQGAVIFVEDWSRVQAQAQQLKLAALGRLTANIAHEIRNPLSAISHANQLLQEEQPVNRTTSRLLQIVADNVQRLDQIVKDVLELNRRDRTKQEPIVLADFLREFHSQFCQAEKVGVGGFALDLAEDAGPVSFDRHHLNQILWNVCRNAWHHGQKANGSVRLSLHAPKNSRTLNIEIADDGPGISPQTRAHLFEPFFTTETTGTGLGLYIARELAAANTASLECIDSAVGGLFRIRLKRV